MKKQIITLAVAALLLSSCGIYTKYERPEVKTDGLYGQDIEVEDTTSIASLSWRELFTDPQLLNSKAATAKVMICFFIIYIVYFIRK